MWMEQEHQLLFVLYYVSACREAERGVTARGVAVRGVVGIGWKKGEEKGVGGRDGKGVGGRGGEERGVHEEAETGRWEEMVKVAVM